MNRRFFLSAAAALLSAPRLLLAGGGSVEYTPGLIKEKLAAGETVFVDYAASWCSSCKRQERIVLLLRGDEELGRIVAGVDSEEIKQLLELALTEA